MKSRLLMAALLVLVLAPAAQAGWVLHQTTPGGPSTMYVQSNMLRAGTGDRGVIYDLNGNQVTMLNPSKKAYWSGKPQELNQQVNKTLDAQLEKALKQAPPEQREQMRAMMEQNMGRGKGKAPAAAKVEVRQTDKSEKIAGYLSQKYQIYVDGKLRQDIWITDLPGFKDDMNMAKMLEMAHAMNSGAPGKGLGWRRSPAVQKLMAKGVPMKIVEYTRSGPVTMMTVTKVEKKALSASTFQPPNDWRRMDFHQMIR